MVFRATVAAAGAIGADGGLAVLWFLLGEPDCPWVIAAYFIVGFLIFFLLFLLVQAWPLRDPAERAYRTNQRRAAQKEKDQFTQSLARLPQENRAMVTASQWGGGPSVLYIPNRRDRWKYRCLLFLRGPDYVMRKLAEQMWRQTERELREMQAVKTSQQLSEESTPESWDTRT